MDKKNTFSKYVLIFAIIVTGFFINSQENRVIYLEDTALKEAMEGYTPLPLRHIYPAGVEDIAIPALDRILADIHCYMDTKPVDVKATLMIDGDKVEISEMHLKPGEKVTKYFELEEMMFSKHDIEVRLDFKEPEDLPSFKEEMDFSYNVASKVFNFHELLPVSIIEEPVKVDGDLAEWKDRPFFYLGDDEDFGGADPKTVSRTLDNAKVYLGWDEQYFYLAVAARVEDHYNNQTGSNIWNGDCIQFAIVPGMPGAEAFNLGVALASGRVRSFQFGGPSTGLFDASEYTVLRDDDASRTYYEIKMPLDKLEMSAGNGGIFRFNIVVFEDADGEGYDYWLQMTRGIAGGWDPGEFHSFVFWK